MITAEDLAASGAKFDVIYASEVIEHVDNPQEFVQTCSNLGIINPSQFIFT